jgi:DNA repair exonuclease SbcCD nuclease subunit
MILFTADWHIKLGQKNIPRVWAIDRYERFFAQIRELEETVDLHIIGGDLFDRLPTMEELQLFFDFISEVGVETIIYDGNHEATKKNQTFFSHLTKAVEKINPLVTIMDASFENDKFGILPYCELHFKNSIEKFSVPVLFTHVRGEIPPHVKPEVDLDRFNKFDTVFAGDLHAHSNTQRNIVYPGSPMTTSFHRTEVDTGYILIDEKNDWSWEWHKFDLPQLIRKTVSTEKEMIPTEYHHTIYELEGNLQDLSQVKNSDLLDKKVVKRNSEASLILDKDMSIQDELAEYLLFVLSIEEEKVKDIISVYNDYSKEIAMG